MIFASILDQIHFHIRLQYGAHLPPCAPFEQVIGCMLGNSSRPSQCRSLKVREATNPGRKSSRKAVQRAISLVEWVSPSVLSALSFPLSLPAAHSRLLLVRTASFGRKQMGAGRDATDPFAQWESRGERENARCPPPPRAEPMQSANQPPKRLEWDRRQCNAAPARRPKDLIS